MRPHTQRLWKGFSLDDKRRFLRHGRGLWDQHRHRIAPAAGAKLSAARGSGQLRVLAGGVVGFEQRADAGGVDVLVDMARNGGRSAVFANAVFECRGRTSEVLRTENPILQHVLRSGAGRRSARPRPRRHRRLQSHRRRRHPVTAHLRGRPGDIGRLLGDRRRSRHPRAGGGVARHLLEE
ncbi:MAG: hypothetical protein WDN31_21940 [Hyphomicrobium sp.]